MEGYMLKIPLLTGCGLFDFKIKYGSLPASELRPVNSFEIELPVEDGGISYVDGTGYPVSPNRFLCAKPGQVRRTKAPLRCYYVHFYPDDGEICQILSEFPASIPIQDAQPYREVFDELIAAYNGEYRYGKFTAAHCLLRLISMLWQEVEAGRAAAFAAGSCANTGAVQDAVIWINAHLSEKITLDELSQKVFLSPIYFRNLFRRVVGVSPNEYVLNRRMERAKQLLSTTDRSLGEISEQCGFSSQSYFGKVFKASTGHTPNGYRIWINNQYP